MAIVFPASPSVNDTFTEGSITYKWDGDKWVGLGLTPADRLVEGSNKLEIDANSDLLWDGGRVGFGGNGIGSGLGVYLQRNSPATTHFYEASDGTKTMISGVDSTNDYVKMGSLSSHRVGLVAGNSEKLSILPGGNIGINDTTPENTLSIKNIGSFDGDANSFYLGSNFTGTGQNFSGSGKHAQRFFFNNASSNGYLSYSNTGATGTAGDAITWQERLRITSAGQSTFIKRNNNADDLLFGYGTSTGIYAGIGGYNNFNTNQLCDLTFWTNGSTGSCAPTEKLRITSGGTVLMGGQTASYDGGFVNLELRKDSATVGGSMTLVNDESATAGATCQIDCYQNFRAAGKIVFGRENANNWQTSAAGADSFLAFHTNDSGTEAERLRIRSNGDLILGPYDPVGSYTDASLNVPYEIKVAPFGWQNNTEIAGISMGNHSGSTGNDEGEIVFKTTLNAHQGTTGLVERARINNNGSFTVSTYGGLEANGNPDNFALWQCSGGRITMASSGAWQRMFHCGHTCNATLRLYVTSGNAVNGGGHMFEYKICVVYGAASISQTATYVYGTTQGNIQAVAVQYNNSGYQLEAQVSWTQFTSLPVVNWVLEGQSSSSWSP
jgi:hypothetical protein